MRKTILEFLRNEDGAVTVDWVVLTAAVVGLAGAAVGSLNNATTNVATSISNAVANTTVNTGL